MKAGMKREKAPNGGRRRSVLVKLLVGILVPLLLILTLVGGLVNQRVSKAVISMQDEKLQVGCQYSAAQVESFFNKVFGVAETRAANPRIVATLKGWQAGAFEHSPHSAGPQREHHQSAAEAESGEGGAGRLHHGL